MKFCNLGIETLTPGRHNVRDPRLDAADRLVEAKRKVYAQVDVVTEEDLERCDAVVTTQEGAFELILRDHERVEQRLGRDPSAAERAALLRLKAHLEAECTVRDAPLPPEDRQALAIHSFFTARPVVVASAEELPSPEALLLRAFRESGHICFLTVGGKENRAWPIRAGVTAWEAAGAIHTDLQRGFIRAEIIAFDDLIAAGGETQAKRAGKMRLETRDYVMADYDVANFRCTRH